MIDTLLTRIQQYARMAEDRVIELAKEFEAEIIDANTAQLDEGRLSTTKSIEPPYTAFTKRIKRVKGQPTNRVTLKDEGDFHDSFEVRFDRRYFAIYATDEKAGKLERKYGKDIYGLTPDNLQDIIDAIRPNMVKDFEQFVLNG